LEPDTLHLRGNPRDDGRHCDIEGLRVARHRSYSIMLFPRDGEILAFAFGVERLISLSAQSARTFSRSSLLSLSAIQISAP
jgi:hypothetical protein